MNNSIKKIGLIGLVVIVSAGLFSFKSNYFEISKNLDIFASLYKELNTYYVDDVEPADLMRKGIDAMLKSLDPYTNYISEAEIEGYKMQTTGKYGGIGAAIRTVGDYVVITEPYKDFPADKAGLKAGDKIKEIEGKTAKGKNSDEISKILRGQPGSEVNFKVERPGEPKDIPIKLMREQVKIKSVPYSGIIADDIAYVKLNSFTRACSKEVAIALTQLKKDNELKGVVFDLRGNRGGLLEEARNVSNIFIEKDMEIVSTKGKIEEWAKTLNAKRDAVDSEIPLVVLTDKSSASASEIVSGVVQDYDRGLIVGQRTFGKGLVQTTKNLGYNSKLKLTTAKYYTPSGRCIQAINYSEKGKDGVVKKMPDSLRTEFKTQNGRIVYDGGGVKPDVEIDIKKYANITRSLTSKNHIFNFVTEYVLKNDSIAEPEDFELTDNDFEDFVQYLDDKEYDYKTKSELLLQDLKDATEKENYYEAVKTDLTELVDKITNDKNNDIVKHKKEILDLIELEIISRYYYSEGRIRCSLTRDEEVLKAIELLKDNKQYEDILSGV